MCENKDYLLARAYILDFLDFVHAQDQGDA